MSLRSQFALLTLLFFLAACTARTDIKAAEATRLAATPANTPTTGPTRTPLPTLIPQPTATEGKRLHLKQAQSQPLNGTEPWLAFPCADPVENNVPTIANGDGSGCVPFSLPGGIPADRTWIASYSARGSYAAFRVSIPPQKQNEATAPKPLKPYQLEANGLDDQIWIVKLPENRIIRQISQIDPDGWARLQKLWQNPPAQSSAASYVPAPLGVILDPQSYQWSPNGRYLAYTGMDAAGVDLFIYDAQMDVVRRMSHGRQGAMTWQWSPNSKWILYHEITGCRLETLCQLEQADRYFAVAFPKPEYQFDSRFPIASVDWIAKDRYVVQDQPADGQPHTRLIQVDLKSGAVTSLYDQPFYAYTYLPKQGTYLLELPAKPENDRKKGVYIFNPVDKELKPFEMGDYADYSVRWDQTLQRFVLSKALTAETPDQKEVILFSPVMTDPTPLGTLRSDTFHFSPDQLWFTAQLDSGSWALFNKDGKLVQELGAEMPTRNDPVTWLKDSSAFYFYKQGKECGTPFGCIYLHGKDQNWNARLIGQLKSESDNPQMIEP